MVRPVLIFFVFLITVGGVFGQKDNNKKKKDTRITDKDYQNEDDKKQKLFVTIGPEIDIIIPTDFGARPNILYSDTMYTFSPNVSYRIGACLRFDFSRTFSLQTGLYYINRNYSVKVGRSNPIQTEIEQEFYSNTINYTGFELPIMGLFYVQLGRQWFMNNAVGFSADFYPSSILKGGGSDPYQIYGGRNSWCVPAMKAAIGFEWRSENAGYFYLGGQFHRPFFPIFSGFVERSQLEPYGYQTAEIPQSGTYFSVDIKYFFPTGKKNKWTQNR